MFFGEYDPNGYSDDDRQPVGGFDIPDTSTGVRVSYTCHDNHERLYCELGLLADEGRQGGGDALVDDYVRYSNVPGCSTDNSLLAQVQLRVLKRKHSRDPNEYYEWDPNETLDKTKFEAALSDSSVLMHALRTEACEGGGGGIHRPARDAAAPLRQAGEHALANSSIAAEARDLKSIPNAHYSFLLAAKSLLQELGGTHQALTISKSARPLLLLLATRVNRPWRLVLS
jgi:hypothetical protein